MASIPYRRRESYEESWNRPPWNVQVGDLIMYAGRLAEVVQAGMWLSSIIVQVTDEGGIKHEYTVTGSADLGKLQKEGECVLDAVNRAQGWPSSKLERRRRIAEIWLADPQVGDLFRIKDGRYLELVEIGEAGGIWAALYTFAGDGSSRPKVTGAHHGHAVGLRNALALKTRPVYDAEAIASMRPDFADSPDVFPLGSSPLWTGGGEFDLRCLARHNFNEIGGTE